MYASGVLGNYAAVTYATIHGIEPALVPAIIGADMAIEAINPAMRTPCEVNRIDLVALATGVFIFGVCYLRRQQQAGRQDGENGEKNTHGNALF